MRWTKPSRQNLPVV